MPFNLEFYSVHDLDDEGKPFASMGVIPLQNPLDIPSVIRELKKIDTVRGEFVSEDVAITGNKEDGYIMRTSVVGAVIAMYKPVDKSFHPIYGTVENKRNHDLGYMQGQLMVLHQAIDNYEKLLRKAKREEKRLNAEIEALVNS